jgi:hypothetical protein
MKKVIESVPGYSYGAPDVPRSPVSTYDLESLKISAGLTDEDQRYLRLAGEVLSRTKPSKLSSTGAAASSPAFPTSPVTLARPKAIRFLNI